MKLHKPILVIFALLTFSSTQAASLKLYQPGQPGPVDYSRYGKFSGVGTASYSYKVKDQDGLAKAVGEGIFPNRSVFLDPAYLQLQNEGQLTGNQWDFINNKNDRLNFYKWTTVAEQPGVKQYYTAMFFENMEMWPEAIKAYYAVVIHFPNTVGWTYWHTPWYMGPSALDRVEFLCRNHPEAGMKLVGGYIRVVNGFEDDISKDIFIVDPGRLVKGVQSEKKVSLDHMKIKRTLGGSNTQLVEYKNGHWQFWSTASRLS